ncbi:Phytoene synthase [Rubrivivax sp. A210]|uniref:squalene synthase HpnC n=1 Tax=Rubrivivax sp. A210 TaxID=2772301 RepID=UPI001917D22B|nr:squalene synthase HpnC [Rubrivivax sp. A210]CAD5374706.1 Phytoene synthase [Rubrivivax sp. A210]
MSIDHYENFPVASLLCPPAIRPAVLAIYRFARTGDDLADEGTASVSRRLEDLSAYRGELQAAVRGHSSGLRWRAVFEPLAVQIRQRRLPPALLHDLLDAFEQDVNNPTYPDRAALLDYCRRSANPIGRLMLHLHGVHDAHSLEQSDAVCTALQLINFWQDLSVDGPRGRHYVPTADLGNHGVALEELATRCDNARTRRLVADLCGWAGGLMRQGAPLALRLPGGVGWELRLVVQGGLRILDKITGINHAAVTRRPVIRAYDAPLLLWRAARMGRRAR